MSTKLVPSPRVAVAAAVDVAAPAVVVAAADRAGNRNRVGGRIELGGAIACGGSPVYHSIQGEEYGRPRTTVFQETPEGTAAEREADGEGPEEGRAQDDAKGRRRARRARPSVDLTRIYG